MIKRIAKAAVLALLLSADNAPAQGILEGISSKLDAIIKQMQASPWSVPPVVVPPVVPPPCAIKFCVGDRIAPAPSSGGVRARTVPNGDENFFVAQTDVGTVTALTTLDGVAYVQTLWDSGIKGWTGQNPICKIPCAVVIPPIVVVPPIVTPPGPVLPAPADATYYVSVAGDDANPGTIFQPFKTLQFAIPKLKGGEVLVVRGGSYETGELMANGQSIIPSGSSWEKPTQIRAYPGETPVFRRFLPPGYDEAKVMLAARLATKQECDAFMTARGQPNYSYPKDCITGSGSDPSGLYIQLNTASPYAFGAAVIRLIRTPTPKSLQYIVFDGIDIDALGLAGNAVTFPESPNCSNWQTDTCSGQHIRFIRSRIRNSVASCFSQPGVGEGQQVVSDIQLIDSEVDRCGIPFDPNRSAYGSLVPFWHTFYLHSCGNTVINSRLTRSAGTGISLDCDNNVIRGNWIQYNNAHGIYISGGHNWIVEGNTVVDNGGAQITLYGGHGHQIRHNTLIQTNPQVAQYGLLFNTNASDSIAENNVIVGAKIGVYNLSQVTPRITLRRNVIFGADEGRAVYNPSGVVSLIESENVTTDPKLDVNYVPQAGSPVIKAATDGGNIGAK